VLLLPLPSAKRNYTVEETRYTFQNYENILERYNKLFTVPTEELVRFEDKTKEEIDKEIMRRRKKQYAQMMRIRTKQIVAMIAGIAVYLFVYRRFAPKSVFNSTVYFQSIEYLKNNKKVLSTLGRNLQIMNCNGKIYPFKDTVYFELVVFGEKEKGKVAVKSFYDKEAKKWLLNAMDVYTKNDSFKII